MGSTIWTLHCAALAGLVLFNTQVGNTPEQAPSETSYCMASVLVAALPSSPTNPTERVRGERLQHGEDDRKMRMPSFFRPDQATGGEERERIEIWRHYRQ